MQLKKALTRAVTAVPGLTMAKAAVTASAKTFGEKAKVGRQGKNAKTVPQEFKRRVLV